MVERNGPEQESAAGRFALPVELEDGRIPGLFANLTYLFALVFAGTIAWASLAQIREVAVGQGEIVPSRSIQIVQHLEGGEVESVAVEEGQLVEAGDVLVRLSPVAAASDLAQLRVRAASLRLRLAALEALIGGSEPEPSKAGKDHPALAAQEQQYLTARRQQMHEEREALKARLAQREAERRAAVLSAKSLERQVGIGEERLAMQATLLESGRVARSVFLETEADVEDVRARYFAALGRQEAAREQLAEARSAMAATEAETLRALGEERVSVAAELAELDEQITKFSDRVDRLLIRAPLDGIVQEVARKTAGEVVRAGDLVARIVPVGSSVRAEVQLDPIDVGHVSPGDPVEVTLTTFDPNVFGLVKGRVDVISATTFRNDDGQPYYKVSIQLAQSHVGEGFKRRALQPGMIVEAAILTGSKSLMRYLLKPVYRSLDIGFTER